MIRKTQPKLGHRRMAPEESGLDMESGEAETESLFCVPLLPLLSK